MSLRLKNNGGRICVFLLLIIMGVLEGCSGRKESKPVLANPDQLNSPDYSIGVPQGTAAMAVIEKKFPQSKVRYYGSLHDGYMGVQFRKIDAFAFDRHALHYVTVRNPDLTLMKEKIGDELIVVGAALDRGSLMEKVNAFIKTYRGDGTYQSMYDRWLNKSGHRMPDLPESRNPVLTLTIGTEGLNEPMNYYADGQLIGFDIEFAERLAIFLNAKLVFRTMDFSSLITAASTGKVDLLIANLNGTPERRKLMLFSDSYVDSEIAFLVRKDRLSR
jgi:polar amino acid transport system substrate-binding protein